GDRPACGAALISLSWMGARPVGRMEGPMPTYLAVVHSADTSFPTDDLKILRELLDSPRFAAATLQEVNGRPELFVRCEVPDLAHDVSMEILRVTRARQLSDSTWRCGLASGGPVARGGVDTAPLTASALAEAAGAGQVLILRETYEALDRSRQRRYLPALAAGCRYPAYPSLPEN